ncbi:MAG: hypothetical protein FH749_04705 [Firmicutes bacterium]|nr:hypothetical protein [Bacillota bacterium]
MRVFVIVLLSLVLTLTLLFGALTWGVNSLLSERFIAEFTREVEFTRFVSFVLEHEAMIEEEADEELAFFLEMLELAEADVYIAAAMETGMVSVLRFIRGDGSPELVVDLQPVHQAVSGYYQDYDDFVTLLESQEPELLADLPQVAREQVHAEFAAEADLFLAEALPEAVDIGEIFLGEAGAEDLNVLRSGYRTFQSLVYIPLALAVVLVAALILIGRQRGLWGIGSAALVAAAGVFVLWALARYGYTAALTAVKLEFPGMSEFLGAPQLIFNIWRDIGIGFLAVNVLSFAGALFGAVSILPDWG